MPTVLQLDDGREWRGGQRQVLALHRGLLARGVDSRVVCHEGSPLAARLDGEQLPHYALPIAGGHDLAAAWRIARLARAHGATLHAHSSHAHDLGLWASRLGGRVPLVVSRRVDFPVGGNLLSRHKYRSRRVDLYLAISSAVERELRAAGIGEDRIRRVPSGIDLALTRGTPPDQRWRAQFGLAPGELLFGNVAALAPHKDQATLLRAFARFAAGGGEGQLVVLGEGKLRGELEALRDELGLAGRVHLPGFADDILPKLAALDLFVLSSQLEGLGTSTLDAMALGVPVCATATGGIVDVVQDGRSGLLVPPSDPDALAAALLRLQRSQSLRAELADGGHARVRDFDVERTAELTLHAYSGLWGEGR